MNHRVINLEGKRIQPSLNVAFTTITFTTRMSLQKHFTVTRGALWGTVGLDCVKLFAPSLKVYELLFRRQTITENIWARVVCIKIYLQMICIKIPHSKYQFSDPIRRSQQVMWIMWSAASSRNGDVMGPLLKEVEENASFVGNKHWFQVWHVRFELTVEQNRNLAWRQIYKIDTLQGA